MKALKIKLITKVRQKILVVMIRDFKRGRKDDPK